MNNYGECVNKLIGKTSLGDMYVMRSFKNGKVTIELLQYQATFEPKVIIHNGQISFEGKYSYGDKEYEIIILGTNDTVKLYEKAVGL